MLQPGMICCLSPCLGVSRRRVASTRRCTPSRLKRAAPGAPDQTKKTHPPPYRAMVATGGHTHYMRQWRHKRRMETLLKKPGGKLRRGRDKPGPIMAAPTCDYQVDRLRQFQQWYRNHAQPHEKRFQDSSDFIRSMRLPLMSPSQYLAALMAFWWLDDCGRDAVGWLLAEPKPNWQDVRRLLDIAAETAPAAKPRRRGLGAVPAKRNLKTRSFLTVQRWHTLVVDQNVLAPLAQAMATKPPQPRMQTSCAATVLAAVRGVGPYLAKNIINTLFSHGFVEFDLGIVGPGALATLTWLRGGEGNLSSQGFWPTVKGPAAVIARRNGVLPLAGYAARLVPLAVFLGCRPESLAPAPDPPHR